MGINIVNWMLITPSSIVKYDKPCIYANIIFLATII